jgi:hypothetical protein
MYLIGCPYRTLDELRAKSTILTVAICTVAALHDRDSDAIYGICSDEFRRLMGACMFDRLVNKDSLRAMCIATYWLSDISWTMSGYALRRAADISLSQSFTRIKAGGGTKSDADSLRLWYILYICDQHLATLYGRQPLIHHDPSIKECEQFLETPVCTDQDKRLVSQVSIMRIFEDIRDVFSQAKEGPLPEEYLSKIDDFHRQLIAWHDLWISKVIGMTSCTRPKAALSLLTHPFPRTIPESRPLPTKGDNPTPSLLQASSVLARLPRSRRPTYRG